MQRIRTVLALAFLFLALFLLAFFGTAFVGGPISFLFRNALALEASRAIAQYAALLTALGALVAAVVVAAATALQPTTFLRKLLYVLPAFALGILLVGVIMNLAGIANTAMLGILPGLTLASAWLAVSATLAVIAIFIAALRINLPAAAARTAMLALGAAAIPALVAGLALAVSIGVVATTQPSFRGFGPNDGQGAPQGQNGQPNAQDTPQGANQGTRTPRGQGNGQGNGQGTGQGNGQANGQGTGQGQGGPPAGQGQGNFPPGGPGGPGGVFSPTAIVRPYEIGGELSILFLLAGLVTTISGVRSLTSTSAAATSTGASAAVNYTAQIVPAVLAGIVVTIIAFILIQLIPVSRTNPPETQTVNWDSPQTQQLASRTCMNCHSNETVWPWYAYVAPSSWLTTGDLNDARSQYNLSELDKLPSFRRAMLAQDMAMRIRNGTMPPPDYLLMHPEARLTDAEKQALIQGLQKSLAQ